MTAKKNIKDLLDRLIQKKINAEELDFIYESLNHEMHEEDLRAWLYRHWDEASTKSGKIKSRELLEKIKQEINSPESFPIHQPAAAAKPIAVRVAQLAAVFIIGFALSWFFYAGKGSQNNIDNKYHELYIPMGSKSKIQLSDGTQVWMNAGSTLKYPATFRDNKREVFLEGEAFFDVTHDKQRPFLVNTAEIHIKVLGTRFNVKSYPDENIVETTLVSGSIEIESKQTGTHKKDLLTLEPNQMATFVKNTNKLSLKDIDKPEKIKQKPVGQIRIADQVNTQIITSWKDDKLVFSRERFEDIAIKLERWYDVEIIIEDNQIKNYRYTGTFNNETLEQALGALKIAAEINYSIDEDTVIIYSKEKN